MKTIKIFRAADFTEKLTKHPGEEGTDKIVSQKTTYMDMPSLNLHFRETILFEKGTAVIK